MEIGPQRRGRKESGNHRIQARGYGGPLARQLREPGRHHAEVLAQLGQVPAFAAEDAHHHLWPHDGINLAGHGQDQRRLAASIGHGPRIATCSPRANRQVHFAISCSTTRSPRATFATSARAQLLKKLRFPYNGDSAVASDGRETPADSKRPPCAARRAGLSRH
jgi:hypothetical protein